MFNKLTLNDVLRTTTVSVHIYSPLLLDEVNRQRPSSFLNSLSRHSFVLLHFLCSKLMLSSSLTVFFLLLFLPLIKWKPFFSALSKLSRVSERRLCFLSFAPTSYYINTYTWRVYFHFFLLKMLIDSSSAASEASESPFEAREAAPQVTN